MCILWFIEPINCILQYFKELLQVLLYRMCNPRALLIKDAIINVTQGHGLLGVLYLILESSKHIDIWYNGLRED